MSLRVRAAICAVFTGLSLSALAAPLYAAQPHPPVAPIFRPVLPALRRTGVPLLLPTLPALNRYYAFVEMAQRGRYAILLGYIRNCDGDACEYGELTAAKLPEHPSGHMAGKAVRLAGGRIGTYHNFTCGASCGSSTVTVTVNGYQYTFAIKAGKEADVLRLANSALQAGAVPLR